MAKTQIATAALITIIKTRLAVLRDLPMKALGGLIAVAIPRPNANPNKCAQLSIEGKSPNTKSRMSVAVMMRMALIGLSSISSVFHRNTSTNRAAIPPKMEPEGPAWEQKKIRFTVPLWVLCQKSCCLAMFPLSFMSCARYRISPFTRQTACGRVKPQSSKFADTRAHTGLSFLHDSKFLVREGQGPRVHHIWLLKLGRHQTQTVVSRGVILVIERIGMLFLDSLD